MMFIVAVLMLAFLIFVHELGHSLSLKRMIATHKKALFKSYGHYLFKRRVGSGCFWGISTYVPRGDYQINCFEIEPKDIGSLTLDLEQLKEKLRLNTKNAFDAIVVARGGGSMEDLYSFNDEKIADALHLAKIFSMSAIGHESDFLLSDLVADLRGSTPF
ncbi:hypothetical protein HpBT230_00270 [Helicobacter pylori]